MLFCLVYEMVEKEYSLHRSFGLQLRVVQASNLCNASFVCPMEYNRHDCDDPSHASYDRKVFDQRDGTTLHEMYFGI